VTTRLAIDHMRSAQVRRERYVGPWLPEPLLTDAAPGPAEHAEVADSLSQGFLVLLETLSPVERAVFLLREVFGYGYAEIGETVGRGAENCRQIAARARRHVEARRPRFDADRDRREELLDRFLDAAESGDVDGLKETLTADVLVYTDGGGRLSAARRPFGGVERVALFMSRVLPRRIGGEGCHRERATVNGEPAVLIVTLDSTVTDVISVEVEGGAIATVRIVRNPDKLRHLQRR
jgi:RNA polymerase sigma-70 factor (ECF subfamily)